MACPTEWRRLHPGRAPPPCQQPHASSSKRRFSDSSEQGIESNKFARLSLSAAEPVRRHQGLDSRDLVSMEVDEDDIEGNDPIPDPSTQFSSFSAEETPRTSDVIEDWSPSVADPKGKGKA